MINWLEDLLSRFICYRCSKLSFWHKKHRRNTMYVDNKLNYMIWCDDCAKDDDDYFEERWTEYNQGRL
jgi:hypothetical protein